MATRRRARLASFLKQIWTGTASKTTYGKHLGFGLLIYLLGIILAAAVYPGGFSMLTVYVSYLGGSENNPTGYLIYNACEFIAGVLFVPHFLYLYRRFSPTLKVVSFLSCFCGIVGCVGFAGLAFYYQGVPGSGHQVATYIAFGGFGACIVFALFVLLRKMAQRQSWPKPGHLFIVYGLTIAVAGIALLFSEGQELLEGLGISPVFLEDKFSEWFFLFAVMIGLIGLYFLSPRTASPIIPPSHGTIPSAGN